jgi:hypothetical protein
VTGGLVGHNSLGRDRGRTGCDNRKLCRFGLGPGSSVGQQFFYGYDLAAARRVPTGPQASHESTALATLHPDLALLALGALVDGPLLA